MENNMNEGNGKGGFSPNLWIGLVFIGGGAMVLLNQMGILSFDFNWWALFILLPAIGVLSGAYARYRSANNLFDMGVMIPGLIGLFMVALSVSMTFGFFWNIDWSLYWPIILIIIGLGIIFGRSRKE